MFIFIIIISIICGILLIGAVLLQPGKGDMAAGFGGIGGQFGSMIGQRRAADFIMKTTIGLAIAIIVLAIGANTIFKPDVGSTTASPLENVNTSGSTSAPVTPAPAPSPAQPNAQPAQQNQATPAAK